MIEVEKGTLTLDYQVTYDQIDDGIMVSSIPMMQEMTATFKNDKITIRMKVIPTYFEGTPRFFEAVMNDEVQRSEQLELQRDQEARLPRRPR